MDARTEDVARVIGNRAIEAMDRSNETTYRAMARADGDRMARDRGWTLEFDWPARTWQIVGKWNRDGGPLMTSESHPRGV